MRKRRWILWMACALVLLSGCSVQTNDREKIRDLEYTIVEEGKAPEGLKTILEEKRENAFKLTYEEGESLYLCIGYGEQKTSGYSIAVNELYLSENAIYFDTSLIGPSREETVAKASSFPYLVVKTEYVDKPVVFQ